MGSMTSDKFAVIAFYVYSKSAIWNNLNGSEDDLPLKRVLDDSKMTPKIRNTLMSKMCIKILNESVLWNMEVGEKAVFQNFHDLLMF